MCRIAIALFVVGIALVSAQSGEEETIALPLYHRSWRNTSNNAAESSGIVRLLLQNIFLNPNSGGVVPEGTTPITKPSRGSFVIAVNPGSDCDLMVLIQSWVMTLKDTLNVPGASPSVYYFVQQGTDWYSNEAGFLYGYDSEFCPERSFSAEVIIGGQLVEDVYNAPNAGEEEEEEGGEEGEEEGGEEAGE